MTLDLARLAAHRPDRTAVVDATHGERVTYADLAERAADTAARLAGLGVGSGDAVAVVSRNRVELLALCFATRRLGAALAPVSQDLSHGAVVDLCERIDAAVVVHERAARDLVRPLDRTRTFDDLRRAGPVAVEDRPDPASGVTGTGDGGGSAASVPGDAGAGAGALVVVHDEGGDEAYRFSPATVERNCASVAAAWSLGRGDATHLLRPLAKPDGLLRVALPTLYAGGTLVLRRAFDPPDAVAAVERHDATFLAATALELRQLFAAAATADGDLSTVAWAACATPPDADLLAAAAREGVPLARAYGVPACPNVCATPTGRQVADPAAVGAPFPDCEVRVVAADGAPAAAGESGALEVRGSVVADGTVGDGGPGEVWRDDEWVATGDRGSRDGEGCVTVES